MKVQKKLPLLIITISVIPLLLIATISFFLISSTSRNTHAAYLNDLTTAVGLQLSDYYDSQQKALGYSREVGEYENLLTAKQNKDLNQFDLEYEKTIAIMKASQNANHYLDQSVLIDEEGNIVCSFPKTKGVSNIKSIGDYPQEMNIKDNFCKLFRLKNGETRVVMGMSILNKAGEPLGAVINFLNMDFVNSSIHNYKIGSTGYLYVLDTKGDVISHYDEKRVGKIDRTNASMKQLTGLIDHIEHNTLKKETGFLEYEKDHEKILANYQRVENSGWVVVAAISKDEIYGQAYRVSKIILLVTILTCIISTICGLMAARNIVNPLLHLSEKIKAFSDGDLTKRCTYDGAAEFQELYKEVNVMAENLQKNKKELKKIAETDDLTGLPNRKAIYEVMEKSFGPKRMQAALLMDLDGFKDVNDTLGHDFGDLVLIETAKILKENESDVVHPSRLGGDEFLIFVNDFTHQEEVTNLAEEIFNKVKNIKEMNQKQINIATSIGIAFLDQEETFGQLIKKADIAMYQAKQLKGNVKYSIYKNQK